MPDQSWLDAAHAYQRMNVEERTRYWQSLTPEQQHELEAALAATSDAAANGSAAAGGRSGCGKNLGVGCLGMILGAILTISVEAALVMQGVQWLGDLVGSSSTPTRPEPEPRPEPQPRPPTERIDCSDREQRARHQTYCENEDWCLDLKVKLRDRCSERP